ncbi:MAG TPA: NAD(P)/FAD-dependent oxidoreductase [Longimicrobiales bacterium]|nr:NAD(P)/FAD-dependent oxidoreductase [Longimicrobiales bacterium]
MTRIGTGGKGQGLEVAVVGAGMAGLSAAHRLVAAGARVTLYEAREEPGGRLRTTELDGVRADTAVQLMASYYSDTLRLAADVGAGGLLVRASARDALWRDGRLHGIEYGSASRMLVSGALPATLKLRLAARYLTFLSKHADRLDPIEPARAGAEALDDESIASWGTRELGSDFVELLVYPLVAAYYGATPEETSAAFFHALARAGLSVQLFGVRGGVVELARAVAAALERAGARFEWGRLVSAVSDEGDRVLIDRAGDIREHDAAVVAVPPGAVREIVSLDAGAAGWFDGIRQRPTCSLVLLIDGRIDLPYFGISVPRTERAGADIAAICLQPAKGTGLEGTERSTVVVFPAPHRAPALVNAPAERVIETLLPAVEAVLPGFGRRVLRARVARFPEGATLFTPGYIRHLERFDASWPSPRVVLAGDYLISPTVEGAVRSGRRAADRILGTA